MPFTMLKNPQRWLFCYIDCVKNVKLARYGKECKLVSKFDRVEASSLSQR